MNIIMITGVKLFFIRCESKITCVSDTAQVSRKYYIMFSFQLIQWC